MQGQSLFPLMDAPKSAGKEKKPLERAIYSETNYAHRVFGWSELRSFRAQKYLYVQAPKKELYDQLSDPDALKNLATTAKAVADTLDGQLSDFRKRTGSSAVERAEVDPAGEEKLRALGYLGSAGENSNSSEQALIDPKDKIDFANKIHQYMFSLEADRYEEAIAGLREIVKQYPSDAGTAYLEFGKALIHVEKYQEAVPVLRSALEKMPDSSSAHYQLGLALAKTGQWEAALPEMQAAVEHKPTSAQLHYDLALVHTRLKQVPEASTQYEKALELDPDHFQANLRYGRLLFLEGHPEAALPKLSRAAKVDPNSAEAHAFLADAYQQLGQTENASRERTKASQLKTLPPE
jgi:tetratricopeptide (TPR) repeat protein